MLVAELALLALPPTAWRNLSSCPYLTPCKRGSFFVGEQLLECWSCFRVGVLRTIDAMLPHRWRPCRIR